MKELITTCDQICKTVGLITFTEEILNGKLHFFCAVQRATTSKLMSLICYIFYRNMFHLTKVFIPGNH